MQLYFQNKRFRTLLNATALEVIGMGIFNLAFVVYASEMPNPKLAIMAVTVINALPVIFQMLSGYFADKTIHRYRNMMLVRIGQLMAYLMLSLIIGFDHGWLLFGLLLLINFTSDIFGSYGSYLELPIRKRILAEDEFYVANSLTSAVNTTINLLAQMSGATLLALFHHNYVMLSLFNALLFGLSFVVLWKNRHLFKDTNRAPSKETTKSNFWQENLANLRLFRQFPQLTRFILVSLLANFLFSSFAGLINLTLLDTVALRWGNYATSVAILNTLLMLGMIIGSLATSDVFAKWSIKHLMMTVFIAMGILSLALALSPHRYLITPLVLVTGYLLAKLNPRITAYLMRLVPENSLAAVSSIMGTAVTISIPFGQLLFMGLATALNVSFTWYLIAGGSGICLILASLIPLDAQETNFS